MSLRRLKPTIDREDITTEVLRESLSSRCRQAGMALAIMLVTPAAVVVLATQGVGRYGLIVWFSISTALLACRYAFALRARSRLEMGRTELGRIDLGFRFISLASQTIVGSGIWLTLPGSTGNAPYLMTMLICLYAIGTIVNLAHDYRTVRISVPLLVGQSIAFWLLRGPEGFVVATILSGLLGLMLSVARSSQRRFEQSIHIRFDKDGILRQLEHEQLTLQSTLKELEAANRSKSFFMAAASHDLRQPLYAASILRDALALHDLPTEAAKLVQQQRGALNIASSLFDNLLDLSRFESGVIQPRIAPICLADVLAQIESEFDAQCKARNLEFSVTGEAIVVLSDADLLARLLRNLVSNAVRYTPAGSVAVEVRHEADIAHICVRDSGIGIASDDQHKIFEEFVQLPSGHRHSDKGVGLGLAIVKHILKMLGHSISVESELGTGTRMNVYLPFVGMAIQQAPVEPQADVPSICLSGRTGWIVEDDPLVRAALAEYLNTLGCGCHFALTRDDLATLKNRHGVPNFVILDDMLGKEESGLSLANWLAGFVPRNRLLLTTGSALEARLAQLTASGVRVCRKPVPAGLLHDWLTDCCISQPF